MTREEAHAAVSALEAYPLHQSGLPGGPASHALVDLIPEPALAYLGATDPRLRSLGYVGHSSDYSGASLHWCPPAPVLQVEHLSGSTFVVYAPRREAALASAVDWHGMPPGVLDVSRPEAPAVVASIFAVLGPFA